MIKAWLHSASLQLLEELGTGVVQQHKPDSAVAPEKRVPVSMVSVWAAAQIRLHWTSFLEFPAKFLVWKLINQSQERRKEVKYPAALEVLVCRISAAFCVNLAFLLAGSQVIFLRDVNAAFLPFLIPLLLIWHKSASWKSSSGFACVVTITSNLQMRG